MQKQLSLIKRPDSGFPKDLSLFQISLQEIPGINRDNENSVLVKVIYISIDPVMRVWMSGAKTYLPSLALNETMYAFGVGEIVNSQSKNFKKGDIVSGVLRIQEYCVIDVSTHKHLQKIPFLFPGIPLSYYLNILGINGFTAYQGLVNICKPKKGETVVVSTAAGATGIFVCQFAKKLGCRVVGLTGSEEKKRFLLDGLGVDAVINYNLSKNIKNSLKENCPKGIDVYFDNVGEDVLDAVLALMNDYGRVALSGATKIYNSYNNRTGLKNYHVIISKRILMRGFTFNECLENLPEVMSFILEMIQENKLIIKEEILEGIENAPLGLQKLFMSKNIGKVLIKIDKNFKEKNFSKL